MNQRKIRTGSYKRLILLIFSRFCFFNPADNDCSDAAVWNLTSTFDYALKSDYVLNFSSYSLRQDFLLNCRHEVFHGGESEISITAKLASSRFFGDSAGAGFSRF
jgi:hypothetical protein